MIYSITLNPAIDKILHVQGELTRGKNNRVFKKIIDIGGKTTHVSIVLSILDTPNVLTGFIGENRKDVLYKLLKDRNINPEFYELSGESVRETIVVMDETHSGSYMITEVGPEISTEQLNDFINNLTGKLVEEDIVVISGNPSMKMSVMDFTLLLKKVKKTGAKMIIDASGEYLKASLDIGPYLIKPNQFELAEITGHEINTIEDCIKACKKIEHLNIEYLVVSFGREGSLLIHKGEVFMALPYKVTTVNDTGCGDAFVGGLVYGLYNNHEIEEVLRFATAIGASKAMQETSSGFILEDALKFKEKIEVRKLDVTF